MLHKKDPLSQDASDKGGCQGRNSKQGNYTVLQARSLFPDQQISSAHTQNPQWGSLP